jgi:hypothetical protein
MSTLVSIQKSGIGLTVDVRPFHHLLNSFPLHTQKASALNQANAVSGHGGD